MCVYKVHISYTSFPVIEVWEHRKLQCDPLLCPAAAQRFLYCLILLRKTRTQNGYEKQCL